MVDGRVTAIGGERARLDRARVHLRVEVDAERKLVGQAAVEADRARAVDPEEVDLPGAENRPERRSRRRSTSATNALATVRQRLRRAVRRGGRRARRAAAARIRSPSRPADSALGPISVAPASASPARRPSSRNATTVMLSRPPAWFAAATRPRTASSRSGCVGEQSRRSVGLDHRRQAVGAEQEYVVGAGATVSVSTSTCSSGPSARVMIERCGCSSACSLGEPALATQLLDQRVVEVSGAARRRGRR